MKKLFAIIFMISVFVVVAVFLKTEKRKTVTEKFDDATYVIDENAVQVDNGKLNEFRGVWFSYKEIVSFINGNSEKDYRLKVEDAIIKCKENGINNVFYHGRAFCDSLYFSDIFPVCEYITDNNIAFDPLKCFIEEAEKQDINVHLWLNPYRVAYKTKISDLSESSPALKLYKSDKRNLLICSKGIYLNPASEECRELVLAGIKEILNNYKVSGIHFDDYFYPESDVLGDEKIYESYKNKGGMLTLTQWRCENVNALIGGVYELVKSVNENYIFSVSPCGDLDICKKVFYADAEKWLNEDGFADYIIPQIYFGFENEYAPFCSVAKRWETASRGSGKLVLGMAAYKQGERDENAGIGEKEWIENSDILSRQYEYIEGKDCWKGFCLFSYSYCFQ